MRAVQIRSYGGPEVLSVNDVDFAATPGPGQVLVDVAAAGVNPVDWKIREGYMKDLMPLEFPVTLGNEIAGTVAADRDGDGYVDGYYTADGIYHAVQGPPCPPPPPPPPPRAGERG